MKFKSKIVFLVIIIFTFFIITSLLFTVASLDSRGQKEIHEYEKSERQKVDQNLQNYVHIAYTAVATNYMNATDKAYLTKFYGQRLSNIVDVVETILRQRVGKMSQQQAQAAVREVIQNIRYNRGDGYIWIIDANLPFPRMIIEPIRPELNGKVLEDSTFINAAGTMNSFVEAVEVCKKSGSGFVNFTWEKPSLQRTDSSNIEVPKFCYVRLFKELNWIIGTGMYLDDAVEEAKEKSKSDLANMRYDNGKGYYWINDDRYPTPMLVMNPTFRDGENKIHTGKRYNIAFGEDKNLYEAFRDQAKIGDGGFVDYRWDKPLPNGEIIENAPKQSFVKYFEPLGWVVGSGVYIDDIDAGINKRTEAMNRDRQSMIINYLIISITLAALSVAFLIFMINRHFKTLQDYNKATIAAVEDNGTTEQPKSGTEVKKVPEPVKNQDDVVDAAGKLLRLFLAEQTKLTAFNKALENNADFDEIKSLSNDVKSLAQELRRNSEEIREYLRTENDQNKVK